jgi:hypothetical protein
MKHASLKTILGTLALLATPAALAGSSTSIPAFESKMTTARTASSPGGITVTRSEMAGALSSFVSDDGVVDSAERQYLTARQGDAAFQTNLTGQAWNYFYYFRELNDAATSPAYTDCYPYDPGQAAEMYGASGGLSSKSQICDAYLPAPGGVANQITLQTLYFYSFNSTDVGTFSPINVRELINKLSPLTTSQDELDGAVAFITELSRTSDRLYVATWRNDYGRQYPGGLGGFVVVAIDTDRRNLRFVELLTWSE